jgi:hypothetical protein
MRYAWVCFRCGQTSPASAGSCRHCGAPSHATGRQIEAMRAPASVHAEALAPSSPREFLGTLSDGERRLYFVLWAVSFITWLASGIAFFSSAATQWFWVAWPAGILAIVFGMAVRYGNHVWPLSRLFSQVKGASASEIANVET